MRFGLLFLTCGLLPLIAGATPALAEGPGVEAPADGGIDDPTPLPSHTEAETRPEPAWAGTVELYGFGPLRTRGTTTVRGVNSDFDLDLDQVLRPLTGIATVRGSVEYGRLGLLTDISYLSIKGSEGSTRGAIQVDRSLGSLDRRSASLDIGPRTRNASLSTIQGIYDLALRYRFGDRETAVARPGSFTVIPYAGVRIVNVQSQVGIEAQGSGSGLTFSGPRNSISLEGPPRSFVRYGNFNSTVAQPLLGTQAMVFLSPRLRIFGRADIGGFGIGQPDNISWNTQAGVGYAIGNSTQLNLSWRLLHLGGSNGATPRNAYLINENGIEVGVKFFF
ncbi:hypothetical protein [Synechococcus sp. CCY 9618]|uniref:hypothetical protein n=1 Tax=Synechococcus sp. CCY 9618 TaxID=2815602 RepID=UPI001C21B78D|nr:hypothetical protein [Synechococcus sp. CCY 9618]